MNVPRLIAVAIGLALPLAVAAGADAATHRHGRPGRVTTATYRVPHHHTRLHQARMQAPTHYAQAGHRHSQRS